MKRFMKVLLAACLTGAVMGGGFFCGALSAGMIVKRDGPSDDYMFVQAQIVEIQSALEEMAQPMPQGFDEMAGLENDEDNGGEL